MICLNKANVLYVHKMQSHSGFTEVAVTNLTASDVENLRLEILPPDKSPNGLSNSA